MGSLVWFLSRVERAPRQCARSVIRDKMEQKMAQEKRVQKLSRVLERSGCVRLAVLFDSQTKERVHSTSDVDVGIVAQTGLSPVEELNLARALQKAVQLVVSVVRIDQGDTRLGREVAATGFCLFEEAPGTFAAYRASAG